MASLCDAGLFFRFIRIFFKLIKCYRHEDRDVSCKADYDNSLCVFLWMTALCGLSFPTFSQMLLI